MNAYQQHYTAIIGHGRPRSPRGLQVRELWNRSIEFGAHTMFGRYKFNRALAFMEMLQFIGGTFSQDAIRAVARNARIELFGAQSAHGPRVVDQIPAILRALANDPDTRRAVLVLPCGFEAGTGDAPCTSTFQVQQYDGILHATVTMRSSDAILGLPYDVVQFGGMLQALALATDLTAGTVHLFMANAHVYDDTARLGPTGGVSQYRLLPVLPGGPTWPNIRAWAAANIAHPEAWVDGVPLGVQFTPPSTPMEATA